VHTTTISQLTGFSAGLAFLTFTSVSAIENLPY